MPQQRFILASFGMVDGIFNHLPFHHLFSTNADEAWSKFSLNKNNNQECILIAAERVYDIWLDRLMLQETGNKRWDWSRQEAAGWGRAVILYCRVQSGVSPVQGSFLSNRKAGSLGVC